MSRETAAVLFLGDLPVRLFPDIDTVEKYVGIHPRLSDDRVSIVWLIEMCRNPEAAAEGLKPRVNSGLGGDSE